MSSPDSSPFLTPEGDTMLGQNPPGQTNTGDSEDEMTEDVDYNLPLTPMASDTEQVADLTAIADMYPQATTLASPEPWTPSIRDERPSEVDGMRPSPVLSQMINADEGLQSLWSGI